jgi:hypothetical protein
MALVTRAHDAVASLDLAARRAAIAVEGVAVVALFQTLHNPIAADLQATVPITAIPVDEVPIVALFAEGRLHDAVPAVLLPALRRAAIAVEGVAVIAFFVPLYNPIAADLAATHPITAVPIERVPIVALLAQGRLQDTVPTEFLLALSRTPIAAGGVAVVAPLCPPVTPAIAAYRRAARVLPHF